jgi:hypothetical protein
MRIATLRDTKMAKKLATLCSAVSSVVDFALERFSDNTFWVEVVDELIAEFWKEEW